jgi:hypothetical protein
MEVNMPKLSAAETAAFASGFIKTPLAVSQVVYDALLLIYNTVKAAPNATISIAALYKNLDGRIIVQDGLNMQTLLKLLLREQVVAHCEVLGVYYLPPQYSAAFGTKFIVVV